MSPVGNDAEARVGCRLAEKRRREHSGADCCESGSHIRLLAEVRDKRVRDLRGPDAHRPNG